MFQRNNWKDEDITPRINPEFEDMFNKYDQQPIGFDSAEEEIYQYKTKSFPSIDALGVASDDRRIFLVEPWKIGSGNSLITVSSIVSVKGGREMVDFLTGKTITNFFYAQRKRKGDTDSYKTYGYQLVRYSDGTPLINTDGKYVYKLVNLYGDGQLASEYHTSPVPSVLNNNTVVMDVEIPDGDIINYFAPGVENKMQKKAGLEQEQAESYPSVELATELTPEEKTSIQAKIDKIEMRIENGVVDPQEYKDLDTYKKQLGLSPVYELTAENFEFPEGYEEDIFTEPSLASFSSPAKSILDLREDKIDYTAGQQKALTEIENLINDDKQGYYLLAGYAGTGKTTIAENIAKAARQAGRGLLVLAPTNKAAKVLNDKLKSKGAAAEPTTIHKAIYGEPDPDTGEWKVSATIKNSVVIIDESSMISNEIMNDLINATQNNNILIFMGDSFQLEPVGEDSGLFTGKVEQVKDSKTELTEVKRQSLDSNVLKVATLARTDGKAYVPSESIEDFKVVPSKNDFVSDFRKSVKNNEDSVMIVATNRERLIMNNVARLEKFGENRKVLEKTDKLISIANATDLPNSETFEIAELRGEPIKHSLTFDFNGKESKFDVYLTYFVGKDNVDRLMLFFPEVDRPSLYHSQILKAMRDSNQELYNALDNDADIIQTKKGPKLNPNIVIGTYGYAITAHKSQGSQWEKVFVNQDYVAPTWNGARWYYTAITRSSKDVVVFPSPNLTKISPADIELKINNIAAPDVQLKRLFSFEKAKQQKSFRKKTLKFVDNIATNKENIVAMRNTGDSILIDENAMAQKFNDKAWTKPAKQLDGSYATALKENEFNSLEEFLTFALIHEVKHDTIKKQEGETTGQYEDRINEAALEDLRANYNILDDADNNDLEGADNPNPCGK